jgi:chaperone required for assembly of F1-ATPase
MRRFWSHATAERAADGRWRVLLDGKPVRLPGGTPLAVGTAPLACAIAAEWQAVGTESKELSWAELPLTRLAGTAQERIARDPAPVVAAIAKYGESDLLCYRAEAPEPLVQRQARAWQPWLDWAALELDAPLRITRGVMHVAQPAEALRALHHAVAAYDALGLAGLGVAVPALGSLVLGLALAAGRLDAAAAHSLSVLDESFQEELWGLDEEAARRRQEIAGEIADAARLIRLSRASEILAEPAGTG